MALHSLQRLAQITAEIVRHVITEENAEFSEGVRIVGQELGLLVMGHLQAMLQFPQEDIGLLQFLLHRRVRLALFLQTLQRAEGCRIA